MKQDKYFSQERLNLHKQLREMFAESTESDMTPEDKAKGTAHFDKMIIEEMAKPRAKYHISITAHTAGDDCMLVYGQTTDENPISDHTTLYDWLHKRFPLIDWVQDDGSDTDEEQDTDYCQYVCYTDGKAYLLAVYQIEETETPKI